MSLDFRALIKETINFKSSPCGRRVFSAPRHNLACIVEKKSSPLTSPSGVRVTMGGCARLGARRWAAFAGAAFFFIAATFSLPFKASAQNTAIPLRRRRRPLLGAEDLQARRHCPQVMAT